MKYLYLILIGSATISLFSCKHKTPEKIIRPVKVMEVSAGAFTERTFPGYAEAEEYAYLTFRVSGMLIDFDIKEGQDLKAGELVGGLDTRDFELKLSAAQANYEQSKSQLERYGRLYAKEAISKQDYEIALATFENHKSVYNQAFNDLGYTELRAPFMGNVEKKYVENHQQVMAGEKIIKLNNPLKLQFRFVLPEVLGIRYTAPNFNCSIEFDIRKGVFYKAKIKEVITSSVGGSGVPVILEINDPAYNPEKVKVLPGYACNLKISGGNIPETGVIAIPLVCIYSEPGTNKPYVWKVNKADTTVHKTSVTTGKLSGSEKIEILSGLQKGDCIVTAGVTMISDGQHVKITEP